MAWYGLQCDGVNDYADYSAPIDITGDFAFGFWLNLETKATDFHYVISTGALGAGQFNGGFQQSSNKLFLNFNGGGVIFFDTTVPAIVGGLHYVVFGRKTSSFKLSFCPQGGTASTSGNLQFNSTDITGKTWQFMRRGDANVDRYAKGLFSQPTQFSAYPSDAQIEAIAAGGDPLTVMSGSVVHNYPMTTGTGTSTTDTEGGVSLDQQNMPTDGSQWSLIEGAGGNTSNIGITVPAPTFASTASATVPTFEADIAYSVSAPTFAATSTITAPSAGATVAFSVSKPTFAATASSVVPTYSADVAFAPSAPVFASTATATAPSKTADIAVTIGAPIFTATADRVNPAGAAVSFTIGKPVFAATADNTAPQFDADIAFTINAPTFSATASRVNPGNQADVDLTLSAPTFAATGSNTIPEFSADAAYTIPAPVFSILAGTDADVYYYPKGTQVIISTGSRIVTIVSQSRTVRI